MMIQSTVRGRPVSLTLVLVTAVIKLNREYLEEVLFLLLLTFFLAVMGFFIPVHGEPLIGQDTLAILHPKFHASDVYTSGTALGVLDWTFGTETKPLEDLLNRVQPKITRIHLLNTTCVRNQNCGKYEPVYGYTIASLDSAIRNREKKLLEHVSKRTQVYLDLSKRHPDLKFCLSPALEHNLSVEAWRVLANSILKVWPQVQLVNSPMTFPAERYRGAWLEGHGVSAPTYVDINSLDGEDATDIAIVPWLNRFKNIKVIYVWSRGYNCRNQGAWQDPRARTSCPTPATFELLAHITDTREAAPRTPPKGFCNVVSPLRGPSTWKILAEDKGTGDPRSNLPVALLPFAKSKVDVISEAGLSGYLGYYGVYQGGLSRYYSGQIGSGKSGYQFSRTWAWFRQGKKCVGPFIGGRRQGSYR